MVKKTVHDDKHPYHYSITKKYKNWYTVVNSTGDKPVLKYASCCMASCSSGRHFSMNLSRKTLFYTLISCRLSLGKSGVNPETEKFERVNIGDELNGVSLGTTYYVKMLIEGKSFNEIKTFLNSNAIYDHFKNPDRRPNIKAWDYSK